MSLFCCSRTPHLSPKVNPSWNIMLQNPSAGLQQRPVHASRSMNNEYLGQRIAHIGSKLQFQWHFLSGSKVFLQPKVVKISFQKKSFTPSASWIASEIACTAFTWGTVAVLPFYTMMVLAPNADLTKRIMESHIPFVALGILYVYLLYLSWTPETLRLMFASKYWLPELPGITKMFANEVTVASAWLHLLAVDLFAARHVFLDGLENKIETRHSVLLCLLFCPIGIAIHGLTKVLTQRAKAMKKI